MPSEWRKSSARVDADADQNPLRIAEKEAKDVEVMDAHVEQRHPVVLADETLPVGPACMVICATTGSPR